MFGNAEKQIIDPQVYPGRHSGGDYGIMKHFTSRTNDSVIQGLTSAEVSIISHIMAFAAEESRTSGSVINIDEFVDKCGFKI